MTTEELVWEEDPAGPERCVESQSNIIVGYVVREESTKVQLLPTFQAIVFMNSGYQPIGKFATREGAKNAVVAVAMLALSQQRGGQKHTNA